MILDFKKSLENFEYFPEVWSYIMHMYLFSCVILSKITHTHDPSDGCVHIFEILFDVWSVGGKL